MRSLQTLSALRVNHYSPQLTGPEELMWTAMASLYILPEFHASSSEEEGGREGPTNNGVAVPCEWRHGSPVRVEASWPGPTTLIMTSGQQWPPRSLAVNRIHPYHQHNDYYLKNTNTMESGQVLVGSLPLLQALVPRLRYDGPSTDSLGRPC